MATPPTRAGRARRAAVIALLAFTLVFGVASWHQPAPSAAESVLGAPPR